MYVSDKLSTVNPQETVKKGEAIFDYGVDAEGNNYGWINGNFYANGKKNEAIDETEWTNLDLNTDWENLGGSYFTAQYKRINNQIYLRGLIKNPNNNTNKIILVLPEEARPQKTTYVVFNMSDAFLSAYITTDGSIYLAQYTKNSWISIAANFFVD